MIFLFFEFSTWSTAVVPTSIHSVYMYMCDLHTVTYGSVMPNLGLLKLGPPQN